MCNSLSEKYNFALPQFLVLFLLVLCVHLWVMLDMQTETLVWFINSSNTSLTTDETTTSWHETTSTTTKKLKTTLWNDTTSTATSWHETSGHIRDDGNMMERDVGTENREQDKSSSPAIIAPNDTEIRRTMTTAESTTATANISTTTTATTTKSTTISTTDVVFLSEKLRSDDDNENHKENDEGSDNDEEETEDEDDEEEMISDNEIKCPSIPPNLVGRLKVNLTSPSWEELETTPGFTRLRPGGEFSPADCDPEFSGELAKHSKL